MPLIIKPAYSRTAQRREEIVNTIDLFSTILDMAGVDRETVLSGDGDIESRSMRCLLEPEGQCAERKGWENVTYSIFGANKDKALCMIRSDKWKLIRLAHGPEEALYELYDMEQDPEEVHNLYECPENEDVVRALKEKLMPGSDDSTEIIHRAGKKGRNIGYDKSGYAEFEQNNYEIPC